MSQDVATEKLFFDADKTKLVREGDSEAASLAAAVGDVIPEGFKAPGKAAAKPVEEVVVKAAAKPANKAVKKTSNK